MKIDRGAGGAVIFRYSESEKKQFVGTLLKSLDERLKSLESRIEKIEKLLFPDTGGSKNE